VAVGGNPPSVVRAARLGLPMALAIIGGQPARFAPLFDLHRRVAAESGHGPLPVSVNSHTYVADTPEQARREFFPSYARTMTALGRERGWPPMTREQFEQACGPHGHLLVGSPDQVVDKIVAQHGYFAHDRFLAQTTVGVMPHEQTLRSIELFAAEVAPAVRERVRGGAIRRPAPA
jgi:alkanesulfonate monooxygenase SsuD/methylene tetrahydromethanopterin reductase-like flavin-dependent oxidoreductase (luciferase family)